jgi:hypothetical protein
MNDGRQRAIRVEITESKSLNIFLIIFILTPQAAKAGDSPLGPVKNVCIVAEQVVNNAW